MKLHLNKTSPYARLVLVTVHEANLSDKVETVWVEPWEDPPQLLAVNPAGKVPALLTDAGLALTESTLICQYLVGRSASTTLWPSTPELQADAFHRLGLARSAIDCSFGAVIDRRFSEGRTGPLAERWLRALPRIGAALDNAVAGRDGAAPDLGDLALCVAFEYIAFRLPEIGWRQNARLTPLAMRLAERQSLANTRPL